MNVEQEAKTAGAQNATRSVPTKEAITFAFIARAFEEGKGALHGLTPLFGACISKRAGNLFEARAIADCLRESFGLEISPLVVNSMVPALVSTGYLSKLSALNEDEALYRCEAPTAAEDHETSQIIESLFKQWRTFAGSELRKHAIDLDPEKLDAALLGALVHPDVLGITLSPGDKKKQGQLTLRKDATSSATTAQDMISILVADFLHKNINDPNLSDAIAAASWGALISQVVLELQRPDAPTEFSDLSVFVDSPILLDLLDVGDEASARYAADLINLMVNANVRVCVYRHSVEEMQHVVSATLHNIDYGFEVSGPMGIRLRKDPSHVAHLRAVVPTIESRVKALGFEIVEADNLISENESSFPQQLIDALRVWIAGENLHEHVERDLKDAMSVGYTFRLRGTSPCTSLSQATAVLVSRNANIIRKSSAFVASHKLAPAYAAPLVVSDQQIAGVLWFSSGCANASGQRLAQAKLAANCAVAIQPSLDLVASMRKYLLDPKKSAEFEALLKIDRSAVCLVRETIGALSLTTADDAERILAQMKAAAIEEERARLQVELDEKFSQRENQRDDQLQKLEGSIRELRESSLALQATHMQESSELRTAIGILEQSLAQRNDEINRLNARSTDINQALERRKEALERRTKWRVECELVILYFLSTYFLASQLLDPAIGAVVSAVVAAVGFWKAPDIIFGGIAARAGKDAAKNYHSKNADLVRAIVENPSDD